MVGLLALALLDRAGAAVPADQVPAIVALSVGLGLGAAVALLAAERLAPRWPYIGLVVGLALAPLAPLGGRYARDLLVEADVAVATESVLDALRALDLAGVAVLAGLALCGYAPALIARRRGAGLVTQVVLGAWCLAAFGVVALLLHPDLLARFPTTFHAALALARVVTFPLAMAWGGRAGARVLRWLRGDEPPARVRARGLPPPLVAVRASLLLPLLLAGWMLLAPAPEEPGDATAERLRALARGDRARVAQAHAWAIEGTRGAPFAGGFVWPPAPRAPTRSFLLGPVGAGLEAVDAAAPGEYALPVRASAVACLRGPARRGDVDAMLLLAGLLHDGVGRVAFERVQYTWLSWDATVEEQEEAVMWFAAATADGERSPFTVFDPRVPLAGAVRGYVAAHPDRALRMLRATAPRHAVCAQELRDLLGARPGLRRLDDDPFLAPRESWMRVVPTGGALAPHVRVPVATAPSSSPAADAFVLQALAAWPHDPDRARRLALAAVTRVEHHPGAFRVLGAWHLRRALTGDLAWGHLDVAQTYLAAPQDEDPLALDVLVNGALHAAGRALLHVDGDVGSARHARLLLAAAERVHPGAGLGKVGATVRDLLVGIGPPVDPADLRPLVDEFRRRGGRYAEAAERLR